MPYIFPYFKTRPPLPTFNGALILAELEDAVYIRIPPNIAEPCGNCVCDFCKERRVENPAYVSRWDALLIPIGPRKPSQNWCSHVHMPDPRTFREYCLRKGTLVR